MEFVINKNPIFIGSLPGFFATQMKWWGILILLIKTKTRIRNSINFKWWNIANVKLIADKIFFPTSQLVKIYLSNRYVELQLWSVMDEHRMKCQCITLPLHRSKVWIIDTHTWFVWWWVWMYIHKQNVGVKAWVKDLILETLNPFLYATGAYL